jgi:hypothetical protein
VVTETVTVKADAALLQTEGSNIQTLIHGSAIPGMPLNPRVVQFAIRLSY